MVQNTGGKVLLTSSQHHMNKLIALIIKFQTSKF